MLPKTQCPHCLRFALEHDNGVCSYRLTTKGWITDRPRQSYSEKFSHDDEIKPIRHIAGKI